jgi:quinol monooxygenase YgiN
MAKLIVHQKVQDYSTFRKVYDDHDSTRKEFGCLDAQVFQSPSDANEITIITDWGSVEAAKTFATSPALKDSMKSAGAISQPEILFLVEA